MLGVRREPCVWLSTELPVLIGSGNAVKGQPHIQLGLFHWVTLLKAVNLNSRSVYHVLVHQEPCVLLSTELPDLKTSG